MSVLNKNPSPPCKLDSSSFKFQHVLSGAHSPAGKGEERGRGPGGGGRGGGTYPGFGYP